jgi:hypothetical protein
VIFRVLLFLLAAASPLMRAQEPQNAARPDQILSSSPDGSFQIRRRQADPGERGEALKTLSLTTSAGKTLYEWNSSLGATTVLWSPDKRYVAVNDMPPVLTEVGGDPDGSATLGGQRRLDGIGLDVDRLRVPGVAGLSHGGDMVDVDPEDRSHNVSGP